MKLLCVIPSYWPAFKYGGPIYSVHELNKALVMKGIDVYVYTTNVGLENKVRANQVVDINGVKVTYYKYTGLFELLGSTGWQYSFSMTQAIKRDLVNFDIAYIVSAWNYTTAMAAFYCRKYQKPHIISPRGSLYPKTTNSKSWKKVPYYHLITKKVLQNASAIHYTTEDEKEQTNSFLRLNTKAVVVPNGINLEEFSRLPEKDELLKKYPALENKTRILFLSRINWKKGLDLLLQAYANLLEKRNGLHLLIVGDDDGDGYKDQVKNWVKDYKLDDNVTFTGSLTGRDKLAAYAASDIFVLPSYSENFGMVVVEAMACELPVVISNKVGIYKEIEENKAGIIVETNPESLSKGIEWLLEDAELRAKISANGKKLVREYYDIDKVAERMIDSFEEVLKNAST